MNHTSHNKLISFIWSIANDCLRDVCVRGKYLDIILPMVILRRWDTLLEPTKDKILEEVKFQQVDMKTMPHLKPFLVMCSSTLASRSCAS